MRIAIVIVSFLPFLFYAAKDNAFHFRGRRVSLTEHLLHLVIGIALLVVLTQAVLGNTSLMMVGLLLFLIAGALDEYIWHRRIPEEETDLHAKEHLALMIFVVVTLVVNWLESHQWQLPVELKELVGLAYQQSNVSAPQQPPASELTGADSSPWRAVTFPIFLMFDSLFT